MAHLHLSSDVNGKCCSSDSGISSGIAGGDLGVLQDADEDSLLLSGGCSYGSVLPSFQYTQDKIDFYTALSKEENDVGSRDVDQVTDVKRTVAMTASGACEV